MRNRIFIMFISLLFCGWGNLSLCKYKDYSLKKDSISTTMDLVYDFENQENVDIELSLQGVVDVVIDWGDNSDPETVKSAGDITHSFSKVALDTIRISGKLDQFGKGVEPMKGSRYLINVISFGDLGLKSLSGAFNKAEKLVEVPELLPSAVNNLSHTFYNASIFNDDISSWDVSNVVTMESMFGYAYGFDQPLNEWNTKNLTNTDSMFYSASGFNQPLDNWVTDNLETMQGMFHLAIHFNQPLNNWNTSKVKNMKDLFNGAINFSGNISSWDVSNVTNMSCMFYNAHGFDQDLDSWDVSNVTDMSYMFYYADFFMGKIDSWNVSSVKDMTSMFDMAIDFNGDLSSWNVSNVVSMKNMFYAADQFNSDLSKWDVSNVTNMAGMFSGAYSFTSDLSKWDISSVSNVVGLFRGAEAFTSDLSNWDVSNITDMTEMFGEARNFNSDLSKWDVSNVTNMEYMFYKTYEFNSDLSNWDVSNVSNMKDMFYNSALSTQNYDKLLYSWSHLPSLQTGVKFGLQGVKCSLFGKQYKEVLISNYEWEITDGGVNTDEQAPLIVESNPLAKDTVLYEENKNYLLKIKAFDPENQSINYDWKINDKSSSVNSDNLTFKKEIGVYNVMVSVTDVAGLKDSLEWIVKVVPEGQDIDDNIVKNNTLYQNYPNPFNPNTSIEFYLNSNSNVSLTVYNYRGEIVTSIVNGMLNRGLHSFNFDGSVLSSGVYFYRLVGKGFTHQKKMILLK